MLDSLLNRSNASYRFTIGFLPDPREYAYPYDSNQRNFVKNYHNNLINDTNKYNIKIYVLILLNVLP